MFSRISYDSFQLLFPLIGFFIFAAVFGAAVIRVCLMKRNRITHLSSLPLSEEEELNRPVVRRHENI